MQKPQESLDDFLNSIEPQPATPPSNVSLRPTGEVEVLRPLALDQAPAETANKLLLQNGAPRISWFHRSLIFGGAAAGAVTIIFLSALFIAVNEPSERASVEGVDTPGYDLDAPMNATLELDSLAPADETSAKVNLSTPEIASQVVGEFRTGRRATVRSRRSTISSRRTASIPLRPSRPAESPSFVPTTLVIYVENGEIKNRIEPTLTAAYKIPVSFSN